MMGSLLPCIHERMDPATLARFRVWDPEIVRPFSMKELPDHAPILVHWRAFDEHDRVRALVAAEVAYWFVPVVSVMIARFAVG
jgi:hypothetical protein